MKKKKQYKHLSFEERFVIEKSLSRSIKIRDIAMLLGRSPSTISSEVNRNRVNGEYIADKAQHRSYIKRWRSKRQCLKVSMDRFLVGFVEKKLIEKWSPKQISGYLDKEHEITCSDKAIYKFIDSRCLERYLFWSWNKKKSGRKRYKYDNPKDNRKYIKNRPVLVGVGHWEVDFIVSKKSTWSLLVATDRLTKHTLIKRLPNRKHVTINHALSEMFNGQSLKTITTDNDIAFNHWKVIEEQLNTNIYFTHPYHSWEKGLVENTNRWIRCFVPKKRDVSTVTDEEIESILSFINDRPREVIDFRIPSVYYKEQQCVLLEG
ncbi:IS30 family transposase [Candidatus Nomurabacteria bacterium]|nr:IS30 family transposase [Candidatus Nomurabacteria bacterium]USN94836.1 MAG: IS30 family transposase [Candidatus Nomurabacteria bacterium]USN95107.1 MAG: IS30 family transposase [Candidatus Nomurabacteria bacterium]